MRYRNRVLGMLCLLLVITYLDRVCISVAGPRMQAAMGIGPAGWGWVTGIFTLSYAGFEIPAGVLGDRIGARKVLTRIVLWWSAFTSLTGMMTAFGPLLAVRFLFGAGEAGAYPNASVVVSRWFPLRERGRAFGVILMSAQVGGAISPLLVVPLQVRFGWRASFYLFGVLGVVWSVAWHGWFRDTPAEKRGVTVRELAEIGDVPRAAHHTLPWAAAVRSRNFWTILLVALCYVYTFYFFQSWFHTYLVKARGFSEDALLLSSLPFVLAGAANLAGGLVSNAMVRRAGLRWGRSGIGAVSLAVSGVCAVALPFVHGPAATMVVLSVMYAGITFQQPIMFAVCLDVGGEFAGAMVGAMNAMSQVGSFLSALAFGYLVGRTGSYDAPFVPMAVLLGVGSGLWMMVDATQPLLRGQIVGSMGERVV